MLKTTIQIFLIATLVFCSFSCAKDEELDTGIAPVAIEPKVSNATESSQINFAVGGGLGFYKFKIISGTADISQATGVLTNMQRGEVVVRVSDLVGNFDDAVVNVTQDFSLNHSTVYLPFNQQFTLQYSGGTPPVVYSRVSGDSQVDANTGVVTASAAISKTVIKATDSEGNVQVAEVFSVPALQFNEFNLVLTYGQLHTFQVQGGIPPYTFSIIAGSGTLLEQLGTFIAPYYDNYPVIRVTDSVGLFKDIQVRVIP